MPCKKCERLRFVLGAGNEHALCSECAQALSEGYSTAFAELQRLRKVILDAVKGDWTEEQILKALYSEEASK